MATVSHRIDFNCANFKRRFRRGDTEAWFQFKEAYLRPAWQCAKARLPLHLAEDAVENAFVALLARCAEYDPNYSIATFFFRVILEQEIRHLRKTAFREVLLSDDCEPVAPATQLDSEIVDRDSDAEDWGRLLQGVLSPTDLVILHIVLTTPSHDCYEAIQAAFNCSKNTAVQKRLRMRKRLMNYCNSRKDNHDT